MTKYIGLKYYCLISASECTHTHPESTKNVILENMDLVRSRNVYHYVNQSFKDAIYSTTISRIYDKLSLKSTVIHLVGLKVGLLHLKVYLLFKNVANTSKSILQCQ